MSFIKEKNIEFVLLTPIIMMLLCLFGIKDYLKTWYILFIISGIIAWVVSIYEFIKNKKKDTIFLLIIISIVLLLISMFFSNNIYNAFFGGEYRHSGFLTYFMLIGLFLNALFLKRDSLVKIGKIFLFVSFLICTISLLNNNITEKAFMSDYVTEHSKLFYPYRGVFYNSNHFGYYLSIVFFISVLFFLNCKDNIYKAIFLFIYFIILYTLIINNTFGSYLAVLISFILFIIIAYKKCRRVDICILCLLFIVNSLMISFNGKNVVIDNFKTFDKDIVDTINGTQKTAGTGRVTLWKIYGHYIIKSPIIGYGGYNDDMNKTTSLFNDVPHNSLIEIAAFNGIPVVIMYLIVLGIIVIRYLKNRKNSSIVLDIIFVSVCSYFISSLFGVIFFYTSQYYAIILGVLYLLTNINVDYKLKR